MDAECPEDAENKLMDDLCMKPGMDSIRDAASFLDSKGISYEWSKKHEHIGLEMWKD